MSTPRAAGFVVPFEGDPIDHVWTAWPGHPELWEARLAPARAEVAALCRALAPVPVHVLVCDDATEADAERALQGLPFTLHRASYGDIWMRDTLAVPTLGPDGAAGSVRFRFDGWGGKYDLPGDRDLAERVQATWPGHAFAFDTVLEGGSVETDGDGTLITTRQCLLDGVRNPGWTEADAERFLCEAYGATTVIWLDEGLLNDHTDGHVDTLARFLAPGVVACMVPGDDDPNEAVLLDIAKALRAATDARGRRLKVVEIPSPGRVLGDGGQILPASHVNWLMTHEAIVVPTYAPDTPTLVRDALWPHAGGRRVVPSSARSLVEGGGAFHCITQHVPASRRPGAS